MNKLTALLAVATVGLGSLSVHLLTELKSARTESASLQTRVAELERPRPPAPAAMPSAAAPGPVFTVVPARRRRQETRHALLRLKHGLRTQMHPSCPSSHAAK